MSLISDSIIVAEKVQSIAKKYKDKELNDEIILLQQKLSLLSNENIKLREEIAEIRSDVLSNKNVYMDDNGFLRRKNDEKKYCPKCWNKEKVIYNAKPWCERI